jgi:hypothetical protein
MRAEFCQGRGLVGNLAGLLDDPVELAEIAGVHPRIVFKRTQLVGS